MFWFQRSFEVLIPTREEWSNPGGLLDPEDLVCFTDGSRMREPVGTGAGIYCEQLGIRKSYALGQFTTVFQTEIFAIIECCRLLTEQQQMGRTIVICSDSRSVLGALSAPRVSSRLTLECLRALDRVGEQNMVKLLWVPGHSAVLGNEEADALAREGSMTVFQGPEPVFGLPLALARGALKDWLAQEHMARWNRERTCRHTRLFIEGLDSRRARKLLSASRKLLKMITEFITGHCRLRLHLTRMKIEDDPDCYHCGEEEESPEHLLQCVALVAQRTQSFGRPDVDPRGALVSLKDLLDFMKKTGRFEDL